MGAKSRVVRWDSCSKSEFPVYAIFTSLSNPSPSHHITTISAAPNSSPPLPAITAIVYHFISLAFISTYSGHPWSNTPPAKPVTRLGSSHSVPGRSIPARLAVLRCKPLPDAPHQCLHYSRLGFLLGHHRKQSQKGRSQNRNKSNRLKKVDLIS